MCLGFLLTNLSFLFAHKVLPTNTYSTLSAYGRDRATKSGKWYFAKWHSEYTDSSISEVTEPNAPPAQAILSDSESSRIIRLSYGQHYTVSGGLRLDIIRPLPDAGGVVKAISILSSSVFDMSSLGLLEKDYLLWCLCDVDGDGHKDLVAYTSSEDNERLHVIAFPWRSDDGFGEPIISPIDLDPDIGTLMTGEFLSPLKSLQANYTYPDDGAATSAGILAFFDNYQIIGARMIAPKASTGTLEYELKGQNPSIAGQRSSTLGDRPGTWMGLDRRTESVGILAF